MIEAPFWVERRWLKALGYNPFQSRRDYVALYWEPCGDELCFSDGIHFGCGTLDNWLFLGWKRQPNVEHWFKHHGIHIGDSDSDPTHWLIVEIGSGRLFAELLGSARIVINQQVLKPTYQEKK